MKTTVTKLGVSIDNDNLEYYNKVVFKGSSLSYGQITVASTELGSKISLTGSDGNRTYPYLIPLCIGEKLTFKGLPEDGVNIRIGVIDNTEGKTKVTVPAIGQFVTLGYLCSSVLYNYSNYTIRELTMDDNTSAESASNLACVVTFIFKDGYAISDDDEIIIEEEFPD